MKKPRQIIDFRQAIRWIFLKVRDAADVEQVVKAALANEQPLEICGHGSKRAIGQPMATNVVLDLSALDAVVSYEPNELLLTVGAGAPLADVLSLIDSKDQHFAFEPMNPATLLGSGDDAGTVGGMLAAGLAGPRRVKDGGARDHLLGAHAVSGFGETFKTGGKVVKNVTGYDLCKLLCGSWGTLAVVTEVTLKVMPRPESRRTLVLRGLDDVAAVRAIDGGAGLALRRLGCGPSAGIGVARCGRRACGGGERRQGGDAGAARRHRSLGAASLELPGGDAGGLWRGGCGR